MPVHYLLPCPSCDYEFQLLPKQAGQPLVCPQCQATLDAPKLGTLKQLPTDGKNASVKPSAGRGGWKRSLFAIGLLMAVVGGILGVALYWYANSLFTDIQLEERIAYASEQIDQMSPAQLWDLWHQDSFEEGLGEWVEPRFAGLNKQSAILKNFAYGLLGIAALGVVTLLSSFAAKN